MFVCKTSQTAYVWPGDRLAAKLIVPLSPTFAVPDSTMTPSATAEDPSRIWNVNASEPVRGPSSNVLTTLTWPLLLFVMVQPNVLSASARYATVNEHEAPTPVPPVTVPVLPDACAAPTSVQPDCAVSAIVYVPGSPRDTFWPPPNQTT